MSGLQIAVPVGDALIGERVRLLMNRQRPRITQKQMGMLLGITQGAFSQKLLGNTRWTVVELLHAAEHLGTSISFLAGETDDARPLNARTEAHIDIEGQAKGPEMARSRGLVAGAGLEPATPRL